MTENGNLIDELSVQRASWSLAEQPVLFFTGDEKDGAVFRCDYANSAASLGIVSIADAGAMSAYVGDVRRALT